MTGDQARLKGWLLDRADPATTARLRRLYGQWARHREGLRFLILLWVGHLPSHRVRNLMYSLAGMKLGERAVIYGGLELRNPGGVKVGAGAVIGHRAILDGRAGIVLENDVNLSTGVWIWTVEHDPSSPVFGTKAGPVRVKDHAWLSAGVQVLPGVTIGRGAVAAAGAVVTHDVADFAIVAGIPARVIGARPDGLDYSPSDFPFLPFI